MDLAQLVTNHVFTQCVEAIRARRDICRAGIATQAGEDVRWSHRQHSRIDQQLPGLTHLARSLEQPPRVATGEYGGSDRQVPTLGGDESVACLAASGRCRQGNGDVNVQVSDSIRRLQRGGRDWTAIATAESNGRRLPTSDVGGIDGSVKVRRWWFGNE